MKPSSVYIVFFPDISFPVAPRRNMMGNDFEDLKILHKKGSNNFCREVNGLRDIGV